MEQRKASIIGFGDVNEDVQHRWYRFEETFKGINFEYYAARDTIRFMSDYGANRLGVEMEVKRPVEDARLRKLLSQDDVNDFIAKIKALADDSEGVRMTYLADFGDKKRWCDFIIHPIYNDGEYLGFMGIIFDIDAAYKEKLKLYDAAVHDELTGLCRPNRAFSKITDKLANNTDTNYALVMFDIDSFKDINDNYGHAFGDEVLQTLAQRARGALDLSREVIARVGGDEFLAFLEYDKNPAKRCKEFFSELSFNIGNVHVTVSMGAADTETQGRESAKLYNCADQALYACKRKSKNACYIYNTKLDGNIFKKI